MASLIGADTTPSGRHLYPNTDKSNAAHADCSRRPINFCMMFHRSLSSRHRRAPLQTAATPFIRTATVADLHFIVHLQKKYTNELGFLPTAALVEWLEASAITIVEENGDPAGYVLARRRVNSARWCRPLTQVAICLDARRRHLGAALLDSVAAQAQNELLEGLQCWVAADIEAVDFFTSQGFQITATRAPDNARRRPLHLMRRSLQHFTPNGFYDPPRVAGCRPAIITGTPAEPLHVHRSK